jgi:hypothetical protein
MSSEEVFEVLGLEPDACPRQINEAHARLQQTLKPELGDRKGGQRPCHHEPNSTSFMTTASNKSQ